MDEKTKLEAYRKQLIERLNACKTEPQHTLEYWMNDDDISWLKSIWVTVDNICDQST
jgi:hypothetical protein